MRFATRLLLRRHHRRLFPRPLQNLAPVPSLSLSDRFLVSSHPTDLPPFFCTTSSRSFSWFAWNRSADNGDISGGDGREDSGHSVESSELDSKFIPFAASGDDGDELASLGHDASGTVEEVVGDGIWDFLVHAGISMLDGYHDLSGLPWWATISTSTLALRLSLLPVLIFQLKKAQKFATFFPKLPPPFPPPLSGRSFREQYMLFQQKRRELGCPSFLWNFAFITVQFPCFLLWMASIRRMCLDSHPGFDSGGMLWFQNLTDFPHGILGSTFPILIAGLHYVNVQISFGTIQSRKLPGILGLLAKYYKLYLEILSLPLLLVGYHIPQGSLVYWVSNSFFTLFQQLLLKNSYVRTKLGLPDNKNLLKEHVLLSNSLPGKQSLLEDEVPLDKQVLPANVLPEKETVTKDGIPLDTLSPHKLLDHGLGYLAAGDPVKALPLLRMAIEKDSNLVQALVAMGQILCTRGSFVESAKYFESAISKIQDREDSLLVLAYFGAGVSYIWQENKSEGIKHLKSISELKEPDSVMGKACYHQGLVILGRTLFEDGEKSEAVKYLRIAAAYDPGVNEYLKKCEEDEEIQGSDLVNKRNNG